MSARARFSSSSPSSSSTSSSNVRSRFYAVAAPRAMADRTRHSNGHVTAAVDFAYSLSSPRSTSPAPPLPQTSVPPPSLLPLPPPTTFVPRHPRYAPPAPPSHLTQPQPPQQRPPPSQQQPTNVASPQQQPKGLPRVSCSLLDEIAAHIRGGDLRTQWRFAIAAD